MTPFSAGRALIQRHAVKILFLNCLVLIGLICWRGVELRMHEFVSPRLAFYAFPAAVSMKFHGGAPYVIPAEIQDRMIQQHSHFTSDILREAAQTALKEPHRVRLFPADDKGMVDIVLLSFLLFGTKVEGVFYTAILILLLTVLIYFSDFHDRADRCIAPLIILCGLFIVMPSFLLTRELYSLTNPRLFELLCLVPLTHLLFVILDNRRACWWRIAALSIQVFVIVECVHVRSTAMWVVITAVMFYLLLVAFRWGALYRGWLTSHEFRATWKKAWVLAILFAGLASLKMYQRFIYDPGYGKTHLQHRIMWHNVGIGFALHPELAKLYKLTIDDAPMIDLIKDRLIARGDWNRYAVIFGAPGEHLEHGIAKDFTAYEEEARAVVYDIARNHPRAVAKLFFYYKPLIAYRNFAWAAGLYPYNPHALFIEGQIGSLASPEEISARDLRIRFIDYWVALTLIVACVCCSNWRQTSIIAGLFLFILLGSCIPAAMTYPVIHVLGVPVAVTTICVLSGLLIVLAGPINWIVGKSLQKVIWSSSTGSREQLPAGSLSKRGLHSVAQVANRQPVARYGTDKQR